MDDSKNLLDQLLKKHKQNHYNFTEEIEDRKVSTGSLIVDSAMGGGYRLWYF